MGQANWRNDSIEVSRAWIGMSPARTLADIVGQASSFDDVWVEIPRSIEDIGVLDKKLLGQSASDLPDLQRVREAIVQEHDLTRGRNLGDPA